MLSKLVTKMAKNAFQNAQKQYKDKAKNIRAGKGTTQEKLDKLYEAGEAYQKKKKVIKKNDAIAAKKEVRLKKKKPSVKVSPGGKGKDAPAQKVRVINKQRKKQLAEYVREENEKLAYKGLTESDLKRLISSRAKNLEMSVSEYMRLKFDNPFVKELEKRKNKAKGGITMPIHGKKKSKMMARGGMKKKSKMMARGGMKKSKMMARGGMKKTKSYARGGAARRK